MIKPEIAILIPTIGRPEFVIRQIRYYDLCGVPLAVYIGDSSKPDDVSKLEHFLEKFEQKRIRVYYYKVPELNGPQALAFLSNQVTEDYSVFSGDDDIHIPRQLLECKSFLSVNPDYASVHGEGFVFSLGEKDGLFGKLSTFHKYRQSEYSSPSAFERVDQLIRNYYVTLFSLHRTKDFKKNQENTDEIPDIAFTEICSSCISLLQGKSKRIESVQFLRQVHPARYILSPPVDRLTSPNFINSKRFLLSKISSEIEKAEGGDDTILKKLEASFDVYLNLSRKADLKTREILKDFAKKMLPSVFVMELKNIKFRKVIKKTCCAHNDNSLQHLVDFLENYSERYEL